MTLLLLLGIFAMGWQVSRWLAPEKKLFWAIPLGVAVTSIFLNLFWMGGVPFVALGWMWWFAAGVSFAALWLDQLQPTRLRVVKQLSQKVWLARKNGKLSYDVLVQLGLCTFSGISLGAMLLWSAFVRPVTWDNLTLYQGRAGLIERGVTLEDFRWEFSRTVDAQGYDFLHPFTSSLVSGLYGWSGSEFPQSWQAVLFVSVLAIGWSRLHTTQARVSFVFLATGLRLFFEQAIEGYPSWVAALFWLLVVFEVSQISKTMHRRFWWRLGLLVLTAVSWRVAEPFWVIIVSVLVARALWLGWKKHVWEWESVSVVLPVVVVARLGRAIATWGKSVGVFSIRGPLHTLASGLAHPQWDALLLLWRFPLWPVIVLVLFAWLITKRPVRWVQENAWVVLLWLGTLGFALASPIALGVFSAFPRNEILAVWPRLGLTPALISVWVLALLLESYASRHIKK